MSQNHDNNGNGRGNPPSYNAYQVRETPNGHAFYNRVGAAFEHRDGQGHTIQLDAVPVDGRVVLRTPKDRLAEKRDDYDGHDDDHGDYDDEPQSPPHDRAPRNQSRRRSRNPREIER